MSEAVQVDDDQSGSPWYDLAVPDQSGEIDRNVPESVQSRVVALHELRPTRIRQMLESEGAPAVSVATVQWILAGCQR